MEQYISLNVPGDSSSSVPVRQTHTGEPSQRTRSGKLKKSAVSKPGGDFRPATGRTGKAPSSPARSHRVGVVPPIQGEDGFVCVQILTNSPVLTERLMSHSFTFRGATLPGLIRANGFGSLITMVRKHRGFGVWALGAIEDKAGIVVIPVKVWTRDGYALEGSFPVDYEVKGSGDIFQGLVDKVIHYAVERSLHLMWGGIDVTSYSLGPNKSTKSEVSERAVSPKHRSEARVIKDLTPRSQPKKEEQVKRVSKPLGPPSVEWGIEPFEENELVPPRAVKENSKAKEKPKKVGKEEQVSQVKRQPRAPKESKTKKIFTAEIVSEMSKSPPSIRDIVAVFENLMGGKKKRKNASALYATQHANVTLEVIKGALHDVGSRYPLMTEPQRDSMMSWLLTGRFAEMRESLTTVLKRGIEDAPKNSKGGYRVDDEIDMSKVVKTEPHVLLFEAVLAAARHMEAEPNSAVPVNHAATIASHVGKMEGMTTYSTSVFKAHVLISHGLDVQFEYACALCNLFMQKHHPSLVGPWFWHDGSVAKFCGVFRQPAIIK